VNVLLVLISLHADVTAEIPCGEKRKNGWITVPHQDTYTSEKVCVCGGGGGGEDLQAAVHQFLHQISLGTTYSPASQEDASHHSSTKLIKNGEETVVVRMHIN
jgi:hypothetical protein